MKLLNVNQVAKFFQCHPKHVYKMVRRGDVPPPVRKQGDSRWDQDEIEKYLRGEKPVSQSIQP